MSRRSVSRRAFLGSVAAAPAVPGALAHAAAPVSDGPPASGASAPSVAPTLDLQGAKWLWYPSARTLANTFVLFRRVLTLSAPVRRARAWVSADSRYLLTVNGRRAGFGPAPCDPRQLEVDPVDVTDLLTVGDNVLGATVLFYGVGDGTWATGKPGFLIRLEVDTAAGPVTLVSDESWACHLARAWRPGQYKRWYLRALQEDFDARRLPQGWTAPSFKPGRDWRAPMVLDVPATLPPLTGSYPDYVGDSRSAADESSVVPRRIPPMAEAVIPARFVEAHHVRWNAPVEDHFDFQVPDACAHDGGAPVAPDAQGRLLGTLDGRRGLAMTFDMPEHMVGWPRFEIEAPAGTVVELLVSEAHVPGTLPLMAIPRHTWSRFTCRAGRNTFEPFDFESGRWVQLHVHGASGPVTIAGVGWRRRTFPFPQQPGIRTGDPVLQKLWDASLNTVRNSAQETLVDGMGRERQQYSGDIGHQVQVLHLCHGEARLPARFIETWGKGLTTEGFFLDCWPAYDRLNRMGQRQLGLTPWGPILDHGVGFVFDCWHHVLHGGDPAPVRETWPRLLRFVEYLRALRDRDGVLRVEDLGIPTVWIDHEAYEKQRHKQCAFTLYAAAMLERAAAPLAGLFGDAAAATRLRAFGRELHTAVVRRFWDPGRRVFVVNRPWLAEEGHARLCDRSLAQAILADQCPGGAIDAAVRALADLPPEMGLSYPANAVWRLWALGRARRADVVLRELRTRWGTMDSVRLNNSLSEHWKADPDSRSQWSHAPMGALLSLLNVIAGIRPLEPGFARYEVEPQLGDLTSLSLDAHTPRGPIRFAAQDGVLTLSTPAGCQGELVLDARLRVPLPRAPGKDGRKGLARYALPPGARVQVPLS